ncbi:hypothetical protein Trihar35433_1074 [Trichoderma harzianum]|nr:hypothetical protein Trihar35433_1074 [Trichoderma harzianum]
MSDFESTEKTQETLKSPNALWMVLEKLLRAPDLGTVFCVLDGLDECDEESSGLLVDKFYEYFLESSNPSSVQFKLAIVSRKIDLLDAFPQVKLDPDNNEYVNSDIQNFIAGSIKRLERIRGFNDIRENIEATLLDRAQGTFLWVGFVIAELSRKRTCTQIMETLEDIPQGLHGIYSRMLAQIEASRRSVIFDILQWVTMSVRPPTLSELREAIHLPPTTRISKDQAILDYVTLCGHILTIHDQQVSLVHQSARDYLLQHEADSDPILKEFQINAGHAHATLAEVCLDYIEKSDLRNTRLDLEDASVLKKSPLLQYATMHWPEHANWCPDADNKIALRRSRPFSQETSSVRKHWWQTYTRVKVLFLFRDVSNLPLLHIASYLGIYALVRELFMVNTLPRTPPAVNEYLDDNHQPTLLSLAARGGHTAIVQLLLANGASRGKDMALEMAIRGGHTATVQLLLANGAGGIDKVLEVAANAGHMDIIQLLLANSAGSNLEKALVSAARRGHITIVQLLLANGADGKDKALEAAAIGDHMAIMQLLLANGAGGKDKALVSATCRGYTAIVQLLLANDTDGQDTALGAAACRDYTAIVQLLLASSTSSGKDKALRLAAHNGHTVTVQILLANGAGGKDEALEVAAREGYMDIVQLLTVGGADGKLA